MGKNYHLRGRRGNSFIFVLLSHRVSNSHRDSMRQGSITSFESKQKEAGIGPFEKDIFQLRAMELEEWGNKDDSFNLG